MEELLCIILEIVRPLGSLECPRLDSPIVDSNLFILKALLGVMAE